MDLFDVDEHSDEEESLSLTDQLGNLSLTTGACAPRFVNAIRFITENYAVGVNFTRAGVVIKSGSTISYEHVCGAVTFLRYSGFITVVNAGIPETLQYTPTHNGSINPEYDEKDGADFAESLEIHLN